MATRDSISAVKARVEELKRNVQVQRSRREEYGSIISRQSLGIYTHLTMGCTYGSCLARMG